MRDEEEIARIKTLAIPPAWQEVWICPDPNGHIQATGLDAAGRKQYLYHQRWQERASVAKFESMRKFAAALPRLRAAVTHDLRRQGLPRERAVACAVRLLDSGLLRLGSEEYAEANGSYGVATILREHVSVDGDQLRFDFPAKGGQRRVQTISDPEVSAAIVAMRRRRSGPEDLIVFREGGEWRDLRSIDINAYIKHHIGEEFSAKDFRTWHATVLAAAELAAVNAKSQAARKRAINEAIKRVADRLGNTPAVCRASYIDPRVLDRYREGVVVEGVSDRDRPLTGRVRSKLEREVLELIS